MGVTRREFLFISGTMGAGLALSSLGVDMRPMMAYAEELSKIDKVKSAKQTYSLCYYCSVTCGLICSSDPKTGKIINIEGARTIDQRGGAVRQGRGDLPDVGQQRASFDQGPLPQARRRQVGSKAAGLGLDADREKDQGGA